MSVVLTISLGDIFGITNGGGDAASNSWERPEIPVNILKVEDRPHSKELPTLMCQQCQMWCRWEDSGLDFEEVDSNFSSSITLHDLDKNIHLRTNLLNSKMMKKNPMEVI